MYLFKGNNLTDNLVNHLHRKVMACFVYIKQGHTHYHIVYNRVDNDGKCVSDSFKYYRKRDLRRAKKEVWPNLRREQGQRENAVSERAGEDPSGDLSRRSSRQEIGKGLDNILA